MEPFNPHKLYSRGKSKYHYNDLRPNHVYKEQEKKEKVIPDKVEVYSSIVIMRSEGMCNDAISKRMGLPPLKVRRKVTWLAILLKRKGIGSTLVKGVCKNLNIDKEDLREMLYPPKEKTLPAPSRKVAKIKINNKISNHNIWYADKAGQIFDANRGLSHYLVNNSPLFKVRKNDCVEV